MIDLFLNEKSLDGQFSSVEEFCDIGVVGLIAALEDRKRLSERTTLYKSAAITDAKVTSDATYTSVVFDESNRIYDGIRRYKVALLSLIDDPFWDNDSKQNSHDKYETLDGNSLNGTSVAEAESRNGILVSFAHPSYSATNIKIKKNDEEVEVSNACQEGQLIDASYQKLFIKFKEYAELKFSGEKLDFTRATVGKVWDVIQQEQEDAVYDAFDTFCKRSWMEIPQDKGLGYKTYKKTKKNSHFFSSEEWEKGIKEFRISGKSRCFGYADGGKFYILLIDPEHILGNL